LVVERAFRSDLRRHRPRMVLAIAYAAALFGVVFVVAGVDPRDACVDVATERPCLVVQAVHVEVVEEAGKVEQAAWSVESECSSLCAAGLKVARHAAELVAQARDKGTEFFLPYQAAIVARAGGARRV